MFGFNNVGYFVILLSTNRIRYVNVTVHVTHQFCLSECVFLIEDCILVDHEYHSIFLEVYVDFRSIVNEVPIIASAACPF